MIVSGLQLLAVLAVLFALAGAADLLIDTAFGEKPSEEDGT
ncbi:MULTISPECIES: hypothetical protein [unclassified Marinovum]